MTMLDENGLTPAENDRYNLEIECAGLRAELATTRQDLELMKTRHFNAIEPLTEILRLVRVDGRQYSNYEIADRVREVVEENDRLRAALAAVEGMLKEVDTVLTHDRKNPDALLALLLRLRASLSNPALGGRDAPEEVGDG